MYGAGVGAAICHTKVPVDADTSSMSNMGGGAQQMAHDKLKAIEYYSGVVRAALRNGLNTI